MSEESGSGQSSPRRPGAAVRLLFSYDGDEVTLLSQQRVEMTLPPGDPPQALGDVHGFWAEVRGVNGAVPSSVANARSLTAGHGGLLRRP